MCDFMCLYVSIINYTSNWGWNKKKQNLISKKIWLLFGAVKCWKTRISSPGYHVKAFSFTYSFNTKMKLFSPRTPASTGCRFQMKSGFIQAVTEAVAERILWHGQKAAFYICVSSCGKKPLWDKIQNCLWFLWKIYTPDSMCAWSVVEGQGEWSSCGISGVRTAALNSHCSFVPLTIHFLRNFEFPPLKGALQKSTPGGCCTVLQTEDSLI